MKKKAEENGQRQEYEEEELSVVMLANLYKIEKAKQKEYCYISPSLSLAEKMDNINSSVPKTFKCR